MSSFAAKRKTFQNLSPRVKKLLVKALFISAGVKFTLVFLPFKKVLGWLGKVGVETRTDPDPISLQLRKDIKTAICLCDKYSFWKTECYTRALTCRILLKENNIPSTIYIGFYRYAGHYKGHAWLRSYDMIITGEEDINKFNWRYFYT